MSQEELRRVEVLARVRGDQLRVVDASRLADSTIATNASPPE